MCKKCQYKYKQGSINVHTFTYIQQYSFKLKDLCFFSFFNKKVKIQVCKKISTFFRCICIRFMKLKSRILVRHTLDLILFTLAIFWCLNLNLICILPFRIYMRHWETDKFTKHQDFFFLLCMTVNLIKELKFCKIAPFLCVSISLVREDLKGLRGNPKQNKIGLLFFFILDSCMWSCNQLQWPWNLQSQWQFLELLYNPK